MFDVRVGGAVACAERHLHRRHPRRPRRPRRLVLTQARMSSLLKRAKAWLQTTTAGSVHWCAVAVA